MPSNGFFIAKKSSVGENPEDYRQAMKLFKKSHDWSRQNLESIAADWANKGFLDLNQEDWLKSNSTMLTGILLQKKG